MLADIGPSHPMFEAATQIHDAGERAALLTRQLLLFGRKAILEPRPVDLNAVDPAHRHDAAASDRRGRDPRDGAGPGADR